MVGFLAPLFEVLLAGGVLVVTLIVGTLAHESAHAAVLRAFEIPYDVDWRPGTATSAGAVAQPLATVTPRAQASPTPSVGLRLAALAPLGLTAPLLLVLAGALPDPLATGDPSLAAATVAWAGTALPSPQDFAVFWYGDRNVGGDPPADGSQTGPPTTAERSPVVTGGPSE